MQLLYFPTKIELFKVSLLISTRLTNQITCSLVHLTWKTVLVRKQLIWLKRRNYKDNNSKESIQREKCWVMSGELNGNRLCNVCLLINSHRQDSATESGLTCTHERQQNMHPVLLYIPELDGPIIIIFCLFNKISSQVHFELHSTAVFKILHNLSLKPCCPWCK